MKPLHRKRQTETPRKTLGHTDAVYTIGYDETTEDQPMLTIARREGYRYEKCVSFHGEEAKNIYVKLDTILQALLSD